MDSRNNNTTNEYFKTTILTASPEQLQLMLYDGVIRFCEQAREAVQTGKIEKSFNLLIRAENILMEMCNALRDDVEPETCAKMRALYIYCYEQLVQANMKKEVTALDDALKILRHMRETWILLIEKLKEEKTDSDYPETTQSIPQNSSLTPSDESLEQLVGSNISLEG